jgi:hypothetical protein
MLNKSNLKKINDKFFNAIYDLKETDSLYFAYSSPTEKFKQFKFSSFDEAYPWIEANLDKNLYFGVSTRHKYCTNFEKGSCNKINTLFLDIDFKMKGNENQEEVLERINGFPLEPTFLIHSGNGYHLYWRLMAPIELNEEKVAVIEKTLKGICKKLNGDPSPCQVAQIMRVPNTFNVKDPKNPKPVEIIKASEKNYNIEDFSVYKIGKEIINSELDLPEEKITAEQINNKFESLSKNFKGELMGENKDKEGESSKIKDRSKHEFALVIKLLKNEWLPNEILYASLMEKFKNGLGKKTQEENRPDYMKRTIESALKVLMDSGHNFNIEKPDSIKNIGLKVDPIILDQVYVENGALFYHINENGYRVYSKDEFNRRLKVEFYFGADPGGIKRDRKIVNFLEYLNTKRAIHEFEIKPVPFIVKKVEIQKLTDGTFRIVVNVSLLEYLNKLLSKYKEVSVSKKVDNFFKSKFPEIIDIFKASVARKFCGNKKSKIWFNCISDHGKTFMLKIEEITFSFQIEFEKELLKGNDPEFFINKFIFFIDEATRFQKELKNDSFSYRRIYSGVRTLNCPLVVLASVNPIADLEGGVDEQILNRVTKIIPSNIKLKDALAEINETPQSIRREYERLIIELLIKEIEDICRENRRYDVVAEERFQSFLNKYEKYLEKTDIFKLIFIEVENIVNRFVSFNQNTTNIDLKNLADFSKNPFVVSNDGDRPKRLFITQPQEFLNYFLHPALGNKQYSAKYLIQTNERLGEVFSKYKPNYINGRQIRSIELFYKIENNSIVLLAPKAKNEKI